MIDEEMISEALDGVIYCRKCGESMEPDCEACPECGKPNPLIVLGLI